MISALEVCPEYGVVYVSHVCFYLFVVYGVDIYGVVCFLSLGVACCVVM